MRSSTTNTTTEVRRAGRSGFSLVEAVTATAIFAAAVSLIVTVFIHVLHGTRSGASQARFVSMARAAQGQIDNYIRRGKNVRVTSPTFVFITNTNQMWGWPVIATLSYEDLDGNPNTVSNNVIRYNPNIFVADETIIVCTHVSPIGGEPIFTNLLRSPSALRVAFHVGDGTNETEQTSLTTGKGYQGVEVRMSSVPRNVQYLYQ